MKEINKDRFSLLTLLYMAAGFNPRTPYYRGAQYTGSGRTRKRRPRVPLARFYRVGMGMLARGKVIPPDKRPVDGKWEMHWARGHRGVTVGVDDGQGK